MCDDLENNQCLLTCSKLPLPACVGTIFSVVTPGRGCFVNEVTDTYPWQPWPALSEIGGMEEQGMWQLWACVTPADAA